MKAVCLDIGTYNVNERHTHILKRAHEVWDIHDFTAPPQIVSRLKGADIMVTNKCLVTRDTLTQTPTLKLIVVGGTGVDNIDISAAREKHIPVCNVRGYSTTAVAQHVFSLILASANSLRQYSKDAQGGAWQDGRYPCMLNYPIEELSGKKLGIIGAGNIGNAVKHIAQAFGMHVLLAERKGNTAIRNGRHAFYDVISTSDYISIHCPLNDETRDMIGSAELSAMKSGARVFNVSRGGIINEQALADTLRHGAIAGAGLDVLTQEPPKDGNPLLSDDIPNLILTPHSAWASKEARLRLFSHIAEIITAFKNGAPINVVN